MRFLPRLLLLYLLFALSSTLSAEGTKQDYQNAATLRQKTNGKVLNEKIDLHWVPDADRFWYRVRTPEETWRFIFVDAERGSRKIAFDHDRLAGVLSKELQQKINPGDIPIKTLDVNADGSVLFTVDNKSFAYDPKSEKLSKLEKTLPPALKSRRESSRNTRQRDARSGATSPDGNWTIELKEGQLVAFSKDKKTTQNFQTNDALQNIRILWAPDSTRFIVMDTKPEQDHIVYMIESSPKNQVQPRLKSHQYLKPGDKIAMTKPRLFDLNTQGETPIDDKHFSNPWRIDRLRWSADSSRFTLIYNQRGHQVLRVIGVDATTGEAKSLIEDRSETFIDYSRKQFAYFLDERSEIIWMSERDGWNHLYRFDAKSGELKNQITQGEWVVRGVDRVDVENAQIWFRASGRDKDQDPYHVHYCRINFDGSELVRLTEADGTHELEYSPNGEYYIDRYSRVDLPPVHELRRSQDGQLICQLETSDISPLENVKGWRMPERFVAKGRDDKTDIWGIIHRPTNFDPSKKYPVIEKIYAGPHDHFVPKSFNAYYSAQQIAELGFIVVQIDGMGTNWRSRAFHDVCWQNLKDAGFPDRIRWIEAAAKKYPFMDLSRVGIYGGSAGGQNALAALLFHPKFYHVAVADCGCHDNRMDKIWWNEAWMGEMGPHYADNSNVTHADNLEGKLFLTVGEIDTNVDPASTMQVVDALIKADKDFDLLVVPGAGHGVGERPYAARRRQDFFVRHLLGVEPRSR
jgi:dipeptidyl aminopeptidase/acylaminoacyl peptidase